MAARVAARTAAFMPGASPPLVRIPIRCIRLLFHLALRGIFQRNNEPYPKAEMSARQNPHESIDLPNAGIQAASSESRFIEVNGLKLHYLDYGTEGRPPLLCLHGGAVNAHWFDFVAD